MFLIQYKNLSFKLLDLFDYLILEHKYSSIIYALTLILVYIYTLSKEALVINE